MLELRVARDDLARHEHAFERLRAAAVASKSASDRRADAGMSAGASAAHQYMCTATTCAIAAATIM